MMSTSPSIEVLTDVLSFEQVHQFRLIPFAQTATHLHCYSDQPLTLAKQKEWEVLLGKFIQLKLLPSEEFETLLSTHFYTSIASDAQLNVSDDVLDQIIKTAHGLQSSDVHFEVYETTTRVRFRLDGKLKAFYSIAKTEYPAIINKIKIKAQLDIAEKRLPQDGRISFTTNAGEKVDLRISSLPTLYGEKLVLRILSRDKGLLSLDNLGFSPEDLTTYRKQLKNTQGLVIISGPTGSGKTTSLYATLKEINRPTTNILTIEDPIEYTLDGITQVQLKESIGLTFPKALRAFLRQDPDVIMVGEIRDEATAQMAVRAALTGHLVLATLHTNSAWGIMSRLENMGVPSFLLLETLKLSMAQRLVRKLCVHCKELLPVFPKDVIPPKEVKEHHQAKGCNQCYHTGYVGRIALYELLPLTPALKAAYLSAPNDEASYRKTQAHASLKEQAWELIQTGITSLEEVYSFVAL